MKRERERERERERALIVLLMPHKFYLENSKNFVLAFSYFRQRGSLTLYERVWGRWVCTVGFLWHNRKSTIYTHSPSFSFFSLPHNTYACKISPTAIYLKCSTLLYLLSALVILSIYLSISSFSVYHNVVFRKTLFPFSFLQYVHFNSFAFYPLTWNLSKLSYKSLCPHCLFLFLL